MTKSTIIYVDGEKITLEFSSHAWKRANERELSEYEVYSLIIKVGEQLLDMKDGEEFAVIDQELRNAVTCSINSRDCELYIDIITVISNDRVFISRGTKTFKVSDINFTNN